MGWLRKHQMKFGAFPCEAVPKYLIVTCEGEYRDGCNGNPDAEAISKYTQQAVARHSCEGLILDYSKLSYRWGDMIEGTVDVETQEDSFVYLPAVIVVGDACRKALGTLFQEDYKDFCTDSITDAITLLEKRIREETERAEQDAGDQLPTRRESEAQ